MASPISVGVRSDGSIDVDVLRDDGSWSFNNLEIDEAEFLRDELTAAIERARARLRKIRPVPIPPPLSIAPSSDEPEAG